MSQNKTKLHRSRCYEMDTDFFGRAGWVAKPGQNRTVRKSMGDGFEDEREIRPLFPGSCRELSGFKD